MSPAEPRAKGSNLVGLAWAVEQRFGQPALGRVLSALPEECRALLIGKRLSVGGWYPLSWYRDMLRATLSETKQGPQLVWALAHDFVREQLSGLYRPLLSALSPHWLFSFPALIFSRYFDTGRLVVPENRSGFVRGEWRGCTGFDLLVWNATWGGSQAALELAGAKQLVLRVLEGGQDGHDFAVAEARWS